MNPYRRFLGAMCATLLLLALPCTAVLADPTDDTTVEQPNGEDTTTATTTTTTTTTTVTTTTTATTTTTTVARPAGGNTTTSTTVTTTEPEEVPEEPEIPEDFPEFERVDLITEADAEQPKRPIVTYYIGENDVEITEFPWVQGFSGQAVQLDGETMHLEVDNDLFDDVTSFTVSSFVKWNGWNNRNQYLLCIYADDDQYIAVSPHMVDEDRGLNGITLIVANGSEETEDGEKIIIEDLYYHRVPANIASPLPTDNWYHIGLTVTETHVSLYVDGALYVGTSLTEFPVDKIKDFTLGSGADGENKFYGALDSTAFFTTAFSAKHILALAYDIEPAPNMTLPTKSEIFATRPVLTTVTQTSAATVKSDARVLGMSPLVFVVLCACIIVLIALALLLGLRFTNRPKWQEEDHP